MNINYSGWTEELGAFVCSISFDENRTDYAVHFDNGNIARQSGEFINYTSDWNRDGDIYSKFGAWFEITDPKGKFVYGDFYTPEDLVRFAVDSRDPKAPVYGSRAVRVDGISIPLSPRRDSLDDRIAQSEKRAYHQEIERNRKMKMLGIRPSGKPWVR